MKRRNLSLIRNVSFVKILGHLIKVFRTIIAIERSNNKRKTNIFIQSNKVYVVALIANNIL